MAYESTIPDPLAIFDAETIALESGIKDPITGIRQPVSKVEREAKRGGEIKRKEQLAKRVVTQLMEDELCREWLYDKLISCNVFGTPYAPSNTHDTAYNAGALIIGRNLELEIKLYSPQRYFLMLQEGWEREKLWDDNAADNS